MRAYIYRDVFDEFYLLHSEPRIDLISPTCRRWVFNGANRKQITPSKAECQTLLEAIPQNEFRRIEIAVLPDTEEYLIERAERWAKQRLEEAEHNWEGQE